MTNGQKGRADRTAASPRHRLKRRRPRTLISHLAPRVAVDPMLMGILLQGRQGSGQTTSPGLTVAGKQNEFRHRINGENRFLLL
jgi:hypothetical protein